MSSPTRPRIASFVQVQPGHQVYLENVQGGIVADLDGKTQSKLVGWTHDSSHGESQYWIVDEPQDGQYTLQNTKSGGYLTAPARNNGTQLVVSDKPYRWRIRPGSRRESFALESANHPNTMICNAYGKSHNGNTIWMWAFAPGFHDMMSWYFRAAPEPSNSTSERSTAGSTIGSPSSSRIPMSPSRSTISPSARHSRSSSLLSVSREQSGTSQKSLDQYEKQDTANKEREADIAAHEARLAAREEQAVEREAELDKTAQHLLTQKESLQTQLTEKQKRLQARADELNARETQLSNKERAAGSTATERSSQLNEEFEAEIEKLRMLNFDLQADATEAQRLRDENARLKKAAESKSAAGHGDDDDETEEEASKTRDAIARRDATPFADVRRLTVLLEQQVERNEVLAQALAKVKRERDDLRRKGDGKAMVLKGDINSAVEDETHNVFSMEGLGNGAVHGNGNQDKQNPFSLEGLGHREIGSADMISHFEEKAREAMGRDSEDDFQVLKRL